MELDGLELVDLGPNSLETAVECYARTAVQVIVLPALRAELAPIVVSRLGLTVTPTLAPSLPHNPAIEADELRVWVDVDIK